MTTDAPPVLIRARREQSSDAAFGEARNKLGLTEPSGAASYGGWCGRASSADRAASCRWCSASS
jgi:hypothetical protein